MNFEELKKALTKQVRPDLKEKGVTLYDGFVFTEQNFFYDGTLKKMGFIYIDGFLCEPYLQIWVNQKEKAIFTYCEGDLSLCISENEEIFKKEVAESVECLSSQCEGSVLPEIAEMIK